MFEIIGCPMHQGASDKGFIKSIDILNETFGNLKIAKIEEQVCKEDDLPNLKNLNGIVKTCEELALQTDHIIKSGKQSLFVGGDHACAMGTVAGAHANANHLGLLWIDAHANINTDVSTLSGDIQGMPVSAIMGFGNERLSAIYTEQPKVLPQHVVLLGVRDMDPLEKEIIEKLNIKMFTYNEVMELGIVNALEQVKEYLAQIDNLHISFDLDSMDPTRIKGVTVPVEDGFNEADVFEVFASSLNGFHVSSIDVVGFNPAYDTDGYTAHFTNELLQKIMQS